MANTSPLHAQPAAPPDETWTNAPRRFPPGRFAIVEPIGLAIHDWSRPQPGRPRMFDQNFLEWFSHIHPASLVVVYVPAALFFVWRSLATGVSPALTAGLFAVGLFGWTLLEYLIHRFSFHYTPRGRIGMFYAYMIHGVHHAFPEDDRRWLVPPIISVAISTVIYFVLRSLFGVLSSPLIAGGLAGYLLYDLSHYAMHRGPSRFKFFNVLRRRHMQHHYVTPERWYGVSTPLWDYVFRTTAPGRRDASSR
jgi:sterol desaturase/sphingolipid hydroxylase (fatty acid hydroxylase superfamily)